MAPMWCSILSARTKATWNRHPKCRGIPNSAPYAALGGEDDPGGGASSLGSPGPSAVRVERASPARPKPSRPT